MAYDAGSISSSLDVDLQPFRQGLQTAKREGREFERDRYTAVLGVDTKRADADIIDFKTRLRRDAKTNVELVLENAKATRSLVDFSARLDKMRADVTKARVDADTDAAKRRLDAVDIQLRRIGLITSRPKVTVEGVERANLQLDTLGLKLAAVNSAGSGGGGGGRSGGGLFGGRSGGSLPNPSWMALGIGAALPLAPGAVGLGVGAASSLLTPTAAGLIGLGGFGAAAKSSVTTVDKDVTRLTALTARYNAAVTDKQRAAVLKQEAALWAGMDPAQRNAVRNVTALDSAWKSFQKRLEPQTFRALAGGAGLANTGLARLFPSSQAAGNAVIGLEKTTNQKLQSPFSRQFFGTFLPSETTRAVDTAGIALQNTVAGVGHLIEKLSPLGHDLENVVIRLSDRFEKWSEGSGPTRFVAWVEREGPPAAKALEGLAHGLEGVGAGFAPIARFELAAFTPALEFLGALGKQHPEVLTAIGAGYLSIATGLKAIALAKGAGSILSRIPGLGGRGGGGGGGGVLGAIGNAGGSPEHPMYVWVVNELPGGGGGLPTLPKTGRLRALKPIVKSLPVIGTIVAGAEAAYHVTTSGNERSQRSLTQLAQSGPAGFSVVQQGLDRVQQGIDVYKKQADKVGGPSPYTLRVMNDLLNQYRKAIDAAGGASLHAASAIIRLSPAQAAAARATATHTEKIQKQWHELGLAPHYVGLAANATKAGGVAIGRNISVGMAQGIDSGFKQHVLRAVTTMSDGTIRVVSTKFSFGSPSKLMRKYGQWAAQGLALGFLDATPAVHAAFAKGTAAGIAAVRAGLASRLGSARQQYGADVSSRSQFAAGLASQYVGGLNLTGAIGAQGQVGNLGAYIGNYAGQVRTLGIDLKLLRGKKLSSGLLDMIAQAGPVQGAALAQSILSSHSGSISSLNRNFAAVGTYAGRAAGTDAASMFASSIASDRHMISLLTELVRLAKDNPRAMAGALDTAFRGGKVHH